MTDESGATSAFEVVLTQLPDTDVVLQLASNDATRRLAVDGDPGGIADGVPHVHRRQLEPATGGDGGWTERQRARWRSNLYASSGRRSVQLGRVPGRRSSHRFGHQSR